ncbi:putative Membrane protein [uncultured delta proteobacterium]|uniref:TVP38/TMEM64 family membrane protein n=1 Tax=uncultured delta proteobacterium TaxID=34034 RepID=A0A212KDY9_9DELT|nr:putative Membrane protein [uncultured delta proteobacterium]
MIRLWEQYKGLAGKTGLVFLLLAALVVAVHYLPDFDEHALALHIRDKGVRGIALYIGIAAVGSALGVPRQALSFAGGYAFGAFFGLLYGTLGTTLGCAGGFFLARQFGRPFIPARFTKRMEALDAFIAAAPFSMTLTVRLMPFGNNALTNVLGGISSIPPLGFIAGSCIGYIPQNFIFSLLGSGMRVDPFWRVLIAAILFVLAMGIGAALFRRHRALAAIAEKKH